ncbi:MAG: hypothetical protein ACYC1D_09745 [Acidimicrobiales bacterium]
MDLALHRIAALNSDQHFSAAALALTDGRHAETTRVDAHFGTSKVRLITISSAISSTAVICSVPDPHRGGTTKGETNEDQITLSGAPCRPDDPRGAEEVAALG